MNEEIYYGTMKRFDHEKAYGFIKIDGQNKDYFVHKSQINGLPLKEGDKVSFAIGIGKKGREEALDVQYAE